MKFMDAVSETAKILSNRYCACKPIILSLTLLRIMLVGLVMCVCVCVCVCLSVCLSVCVSVCLCLCLCVSVCVSTERRRKIGFAPL